MTRSRFRTDMLELLDAFPCGNPDCETCSLLDPIPRRGTPEFATWQAGVRAHVAADPLLTCRPELWATVTKRWSNTDGN